MTAAVILIGAGLGIALLAAWVVIAERLDPDGNPPPPARAEAPASVMPVGTGPFPMLPPDPEPDPTLMQPLDIMYLGKPSGEYVDDLFAKHATPPEMIP
jgi:hypothetical protein